MSVLVIAEVGVNHNGNIEIAKQLIDVAVEAGADVAKFQKYDPILLTEDLEKRVMLRELLLEDADYIHLYEYCKSKEIGFACTAFDARNLTWLLKNTQMEFVKISSGQWDNEALLEKAKEPKCLVLQSISNPEYAKNDKTYNWLYLWVVPQYPTPPEHAKIKKIKLPYFIGLSDHSGDIFMPLAAVALGAKIIECHITLDKNQAGPDHKASLEPHQFKEMVRGIRAIEKGLQ